MADAAHGIPLIDVFAGPGGLGEGFAALRHHGRRVFQPTLSIESDPAAHQTLRLRSFFRQFPDDEKPADYYRFLRNELSLDELYGLHPEEASRAWCETRRITLGGAQVDVVRPVIAEALEETEPWVLLGGPPCQPFSLAGRSRNQKGTQFSGDQETRHQLYIEYLQIIADFWPSVFVMENVRGLLSARFHGISMFDRIREDLSAPGTAIYKVAGRGRRHTGRTFSYRLYPLTESASDSQGASMWTRSEAHLAPAADYLVRCEEHDIPQARHRLILLGIRHDLDATPDTLRRRDPVAAVRVLEGLPALRSGLSRGDTDASWRVVVESARESEWLRGLQLEDSALHLQVTASLDGLVHTPSNRGSNFISATAPEPDHRPDWYADPCLQGILNHESRGHMASDLHRYLFAACFARVHDRSPTLHDFPAQLLPDHKNAEVPDAATPFADRFRVQVSTRPSTTVVSHIAKDGHYYIHPDPTQCRSLTVREAARLQTFPDNYRFLGNRTQQYTQVGNAVPPLLAYQIARIVHDLLRSNDTYT